MKIEIENEYLCVWSGSAGAELTSIKLKSDGTEYLWQAEQKYWNRHAPLLFPIVGGVANNQYSYRGRRYHMKNHGFARDSEFETAHESETRVIYRLTPNADTLASYPFRFKLDVVYKLDGSAIEVTYRVVNEDDKEMPFSIGAHPAFNCPIVHGELFTDYYLEFSDDETLDRQYVNAENLLVSGRSKHFLENKKIKPLEESMFNEGACIFESLKSTSVALKSHKTNKSVTVSFPGFPQLGLWAPPGAPFICIEPWFGLNEEAGFTGELPEKKGILMLKPGGAFEAMYKIIIT
jgi:galactose mutarotase-like enzyme